MRTLIMILTLTGVSACTIDSAGNKHYSGPTVSFSAGFNGITAGITLVGDPALPPVKLPAPNGK